MASIIETLSLAGVLVFAIPAALAGLEFLLVRGQPVVGAVLIGLAVALVLVQRYVTLPGDVPGMVAQRVAGAVSKDPDEPRE
ncbi:MULTISPECIES: DUF7533 family protein [Saliphagus]|uniref:Uncharacterized protein n=1 Tax=Saliphagus infecundisoli TaxID=1849069 RepID=A0ABD5QEQ8_9EURY|nr:MULTISPECIES: hypothetical protein [Saliphagus]